MKRFFEMVPGILAWLTLIFMVLFSWLLPVWVSIFIILFDIVHRAGHVVDVVLVVNQQNRVFLVLGKVIAELADALVNGRYITVAVWLVFCVGISFQVNISADAFDFKVGG